MSTGAPWADHCRTRRSAMRIRPGVCTGWIQPFCWPRHRSLRRGSGRTGRPRCRGSDGPAVLRPLRGVRSGRPDPGATAWESPGRCCGPKPPIRVRPASMSVTSMPRRARCGRGAGETGPDHRHIGADRFVQGRPVGTRGRGRGPQRRRPVEGRGHGKSSSGAGGVHTVASKAARFQQPRAPAQVGFRSLRRGQLCRPANCRITETETQDAQPGHRARSRGRRGARSRRGRRRLARPRLHGIAARHAQRPYGHRQLHHHAGRRAWSCSVC